MKGLKTLALRTLEFKLENNGQGTPTIIKSWLQCSGLRSTQVSVLERRKQGPVTVIILTTDNVTII